MKILLIGATGMVVSRIATEALRRSHQITAATRSGRGRPAADPDLSALALDASVPAQVTEHATGHDAVISAISPPRDGSDPEPALPATYRSVIEGLRVAGVRRLVVVGGAGSLKTASGQDRVDEPDFPAMYKVESLAQRKVLTFLRDEVTDLDRPASLPPTRSPLANAPAPSGSVATRCSSRRTAAASSAPRTTRWPW